MAVREEVWKGLEDIRERDRRGEWQGEAMRPGAGGAPGSREDRVHSRWVLVVRWAGDPGAEEAPGESTRSRLGVVVVWISLREPVGWEGLGAAGERPGEGVGVELQEVGMLGAAKELRSLGTCGGKGRQGDARGFGVGRRVAVHLGADKGDARCSVSMPVYHMGPGWAIGAQTAMWKVCGNKKRCPSIAEGRRFLRTKSAW